MPWYEGVATYVYPSKAFVMAISFIGFGGFLIAIVTLGFNGFAQTRLGGALLKNRAPKETKATQQADAGDAVQGA